MAGSRSEERIARNETTFRRVNEAIEPDATSDETAVGFVCECGRLGCTETIPLERSEYEAVRTSFDRFVLVLGHEMDDVEEVVEHHDHYVVVVKAEHVARSVAAEDDPRAGEVAG